MSDSRTRTSEESDVDVRQADVGVRDDESDVDIRWGRRSLGREGWNGAGVTLQAEFMLPATWMIDGAGRANHG